MSFLHEPFTPSASRLEVYRLAIIQSVYANPGFELRRDYKGPRWVAEYADKQARELLAKVEELEFK